MQIAIQRCFFAPLYYISGVSYQSCTNQPKDKCCFPSFAFCRIGNTEPIGHTLNKSTPTIHYVFGKEGAYRSIGWSECVVGLSTR